MITASRMKARENIDEYEGITQHIIEDGAVFTQWQNYCNTNTIDSSFRLANEHLTGTNGEVIASNTDKAELLAQIFSAVSSTNNYSNEFRQWKCLVESDPSLLINDIEDVHTTNNNRYLNEPFAEYEMRQAVKQSKNNTLPGEDGIPYEYLKELPEEGKWILLRLYNLIWKKGHIPKGWKHAIVIPIPKGEIPTEQLNAGSYRPIALISMMCKIMERLVANRLIWYLETYNILTNVQTGFRKNRGMIDQIIHLRDTINDSLRKHSHTLGIFLNFENAFDTMWRSGLMIKLEKRYGVNGHMFDWIRDFLTDRTMQVRVGIELSKKYVIENGTPQGSMISLILLICMISDIPAGLQEVDTSLFADDSAIYKSGKDVQHLQEVIQRSLNNIQNWCDMWGFQISIDETVAVLFTNSNERINLTINDTDVRTRNTAKFLGMIFDNRVTWSNHTDYSVTKYKKRLYLMTALTAMHWGTFFTIPPWLIQPPKTDDSLWRSGTKQKSSDVQLALSKALIEKYYDDRYLCIYTDASKKNGKIGIGCYMHSSQPSTEMKLSHRITDNVSTYQAELAAIKLAVTITKQFAEHKQIVIFSDSLSAIQSIESGHTTSSPSLLRQLYEVLYESHHDIVLAWIPGHSGIRGNELADDLAKVGTKKPKVEIDIELEITEMKRLICKYCEEKWQIAW